MICPLNLMMICPLGIDRYGIGSNMAYWFFFCWPVLALAPAQKPSEWIHAPCIDLLCRCQFKRFLNNYECWLQSPPSISAWLFFPFTTACRPNAAKAKSPWGALPFWRTDRPESCSSSAWSAMPDRIEMRRCSKMFNDVCDTSFPWWSWLMFDMILIKKILQYNFHDYIWYVGSSLVKHTSSTCMVCITSWIQEFFKDLCEEEKVRERKKEIKRTKSSKAHGPPSNISHLISKNDFKSNWFCPASFLSRIIQPRGIYHCALQVFTFVDLPGAKPRITEKKVRGRAVYIIQAIKVLINTLGAIFLLKLYFDFWSSLVAGWAPSQLSLLEVLLEHFRGRFAHQAGDKGERLRLTVFFFRWFRT